MRLNIFHKGLHIGNLETTPNRGVVFSYTDYAASPISISMPDLKRVYQEKECLPFFEGLLPEGDIRRQIADFAHVPPTSVIKLLDKYGADIAGALVIVNEESSQDESFGYSEISSEEIRIRISQKSRIPMIYSGSSIRLSLAGAENKVPVLMKDGRYYLPRGNAASSHIIKATDDFDENEFLCNRLAFHCGLDVPEMRIVDFDDKKAILVKRYDRVVSSEGVVSRLHQEDFCQALGIMSQNKYEENGGPGLSASIELIIRHSDDPMTDLRGFLGITLFNYIIGNCDAHAKNFSFVYSGDLKKKHLAPFYDIVCSSIYEQFDRSLAMRIGKHRDLDRITYSDFEGVVSKRLLQDSIENLVSVFPRAIESVKKETSSNLNALLDRIVSDSVPRIKKLC